ncbi:N-6 DNA methylase [uncultured Neglectibacter sp.]|uniref:N-6 DNA methylase n=1 Tax=uncultured Neglectibacter sp. TaxID=1924108 RepID=UPI0034DF4FBB
MLNFDVKRKINTLRDILVGKVPDPKAQVEQITIALIYKFMDDMDLQAAEFGGVREFFKADYEKYAFSQIMLSEHSAQNRLDLYAEGIDKMTNNPDLPKLFRDILRNAYIPYRDPETLNRFLKEIAEFSYEDSEDLGNAFEYLLSIMGSQGDAGQFRTPRHIIDMMVEITAPTKNETILDPACGTAGFLISAYNYIKKTNLDEHSKSTLVADDMTRMTKNFAGYDISPDMVRLSRVNMYLHGFTAPNISEYDTLTSLEKWDDYYDVILANPPFMTPKGGITPHNRYRVSGKRAEILFVDYIAEHLNPTGRAAIIVPEGIVFQSQTAYKNLRKMLVDGNYLYGVISLPAGVFNPYSGVKTSILLIDRTLAKEKGSILFVKLNNDGFDLGAQRREIKDSEIPYIVDLFKCYQSGKIDEENENIVVADKDKIRKQDYVLLADRYRQAVDFNSSWPMVCIGDVCEVERGASPRPINDYITDDPNGVNWIKIGDGKPSSLFIQSTKEKITLEGAHKSRFVKKGDLILSNSMSFGRPYILDIDGCVHDGWLIIRNSKELFDPIYLCYMLGSDAIMQEYQRLATGGVVNNLNSDLVRSCKIPLPPLETQKTIIAEIEQHQVAIIAHREAIANEEQKIKDKIAEVWGE